MAVGIVEGVEDTINSQWGKMYYSLICIIYTVGRLNLNSSILYIISSCIDATKTCNMVMEWQFYGLSESVRFLKLGLLIKCTDCCKREKSDLTYADLISNSKFRG